ncbi:MAG: VWA domain-containing protein [Planctomycetota bacterium]
MTLRMLPLAQAPQGPETGTYVEETFRFLWTPPLWVIALVILPATVLVAYWSYSGLSRLERRTRVVLSALRWLTIVVCCLLLAQPAFETTTYRRTQNQVHVLVDDSASMGRKDRYPSAEQGPALAEALPGVDIPSQTRAQLVAAVLGKPDGLLAKLAATHDVRLFRVQRKPAAIRSLDELTARGNRTTLGDALDLHLAAAAGSNLDAVILVSDGRNNAGLDPVEVAKSWALRGIPIHTVGVGDPEPPANAWLVGPPGPKEALCLEQVGFDVTVRAQGLRGQQARIELQGSRDGAPFRPLTTATGELPADGEANRIRVFHSFTEAGDWTLRFALAGAPEESQLDDNTDVRFLRVNDEKIRVLYLDDRPRWEYRYVKNGLKRVDPSIVMQAVMFDASPRFEQEHSADLPPLRDLPRTEKELFAYHVVLFGDVPPERIAPTEDKRRQWFEMLVKFVEFGGGVAFLFADQAMPERYRGTPVQDLLPVVLEDRTWLQHNRPRRDVEFHPLLDNPLQPHDILLLQRDPAFNRRLWEEGLPGFYVYHPVQRAKPGASVLLRHPTDANSYGKRPILVVGPHPRGTTLFLATDETWRWRDPYAETYMDAFWRNVVRSLAAGRLQRRNDLLELTVDKSQLETGDKVRVLLRVHDTELQPAVAAEQPVFLRDQTDKPEKRILRAVPGEPGVYQATFTMAEPGAFSFLVFANQNPADAVLAREDVLVRVPDREMSDSSQDADLLRRIAEASRTGDATGHYVFLAAAGELQAQFQNRKAWESREDTRTRPAWDSLGALLLVLALLATEWLLRKRARLV